MLTKIPLEIIFNIVRRLSLYDRFSVMMTCRMLGTAIQQNCLYETLNIRNKENTEAIIAKFKNKELGGMQVRHLKLCFDVLYDDTYHQLPEIFPGVVELKNHSGTEGPRDDDTARGLLKWKDTLKYYDTRDGLFKLGRLLEKNTFYKLKHIRLSTYYSRDVSMYKTDLQLLECLSNAPLLESLELHLCDVNFDFLESIHDSCPLLKTLSLVKVLISVPQHSLPRTIAPASNLLCFKISFDSSICDQHYLLLAYIHRKYPNLQALELLSIFDRADLDYLLEELHSFRMDGEVPMGPAALTFVENHQATLDTYRQEGLDFISRLPKSITTLKLYSNMFRDIIHGIQTSGIQLCTLEIHDYNHSEINLIYRDGDIEFIKSQTSLENLDFATNTSLPYCSRKLVSSSVTKLGLDIMPDFPGTPFCIAWVLSAFPSIKKLDVRFEDALCCDTDVDTFKPNYNLKELNINGTITNPNLLNTIGALAPNIKHLGYTLKEVPRDVLMEGSDRSLYNYPIATNEEHRIECYNVDVTNLDLDTFSLICDLGRAEALGEIDIYFEIVYRSQTKRFIISSCRKYVTVVKDEYSPRLQKTTKVRIACDNINELMLDEAISVTFKNNHINLYL